jgi:hypothetical protein
MNGGSAWSIGERFNCGLIDRAVRSAGQNDLAPHVVAEDGALCPERINEKGDRGCPCEKKSEFGEATA